ncbi:phosphatidylinositol-specific phospholipase C domain-containing protein, partial [Jeotgalibacillus marinus]
WNRMGEVSSNGQEVEWTTDTYHQFDGKNNDVVQLNNGRLLNVHEDHDSDEIRYVLGIYDEEEKRVFWGEPDREKPTTTSPIQYDTGVDPSVTILDNGDVLEVHKSEWSHTLFYNLGRFKDGKMYWYSTGNEYDKGRSPSVTTLANGDVLEVHRGEGSDTLWYTIGKYENGKIEWGGPSIKYDTGKAPSVTVLANGDVLEVHRSNWNNDLWYNIGKYKNGKIEWEGSIKYDRGRAPSVTVLANGDVLEVHQSDWNDDLWYNIGKYRDGKIEWEGSIKYDKGWNPSVAVLEDGKVLEVHSSEHADRLWYNIGKYRNGKIEWEGSINYDNGWNPSVAVRDGDIVEVHESGGIKRLWSTLMEYEDGDIYYLPPNTISPINWMEEMGNQSHLFGQLRLNEVLLPGTHDSGSSTITHRSKTSPDAPSNLYNILESPLGLIAREITADFGKTQHLSVEQQLDAGIRYFDLRVGPHTQEDEDKGTLKTMHQLYGEELETILNNVKSFIDQNPKEIIILDFQHFHEMTPDKYDYLVNEIKTIFSSSGRTDGDQLISQDELKNDTLENLWGKNKNVVVLFGKDNHEREINDSVDITKYQDGKTILNGNSNLYSPWPKTTDSEVLREKLSSNLEKAKEGGNKDKLFVSQGIYNPSVTQYILQGIRDYTLEDYAYRANPIVISWLGSSWLDSRTNIVMIDFFDNTDLVERIINSNYFIEEQN